MCWFSCTVWISLTSQEKGGLIIKNILFWYYTKTRQRPFLKGSCNLKTYQWTFVLCYIKIHRSFILNQLFLPMHDLHHAFHIWKILVCRVIQIFQMLTHFIVQYKGKKITPIKIITTSSEKSFKYFELVEMMVANKSLAKF